MKKKIIIFGGGMTGLVAARELARLGHEVHVYEATDRVGGLAKTFKDADGFTYDNGPRFIFSTLAEKIGIAHLCEPVKYWENLYVGGRYYAFPFGFIRNPKYCLSAGLATLTRSLRRRPRNLHEFLQTYYGRIFSGEVLRPLIEKWAGIPAKEVSIDFASRLLPTNIGYVIHSIVKKIRGGITEDYYKKGRYIVYPRTSNSAIFETLSSAPGVNIHLNTPISKIETSAGRVSRVLIGDQWLEADYYLSTIPISEMVKLIDHPGETSKWQKFKYRGIILLFIKINRKHVLETLWSWFPENKFRFYRISEFKNAREDLAPPDKTLICLEIACETNDPYWEKDTQAVFDSVWSDLQQLYGLQKSEILGLDLKRSSHAYPVMRSETEEAQRSLQHQTPFANFFIAGRTGMFQYRMLEGCYESAETCAALMKSVMETGESRAETSTIKRDAYGRPMTIPE